MESTFPSLLVLPLHASLRCGQKLVHGTHFGMALYTPNEVVRDCGTLDFERTGAARTTLPHVFVFGPMHEGIERALV